ncbi:hypothetical protein [Sorangium sp. So ce1014]|uniref:hypothetical protein n=1 Tax=Sorangium sp. So ce1014 TaxID=3133326 RepID=UPI003F5DD4F6
MQIGADEHAQDDVHQVLPAGQPSLAAPRRRLDGDIGHGNADIGHEERDEDGIEVAMKLDVGHERELERIDEAARHMEPHLDPRVGTVPETAPVPVEVGDIERAEEADYGEEK